MKLLSVIEFIDYNLLCYWNILIVMKENDAGSNIYTKYKVTQRYFWAPWLKRK